MDREGNYLAADQVFGTASPVEVRAVGNVVLLTPQGDKLVGDNVRLTDTLRDGTVENLMVVLEGGGRIAASRGTRLNGISTFNNAIYSPCPVTTATGCPEEAELGGDGRARDRRSEKHAYPLRGCAAPAVRTQLAATADFHLAKSDEGVTGLLVPIIALSSRNGLEFAFPITGNLGRIAMQRSPRISTPAYFRRSKRAIASWTVSARSRSAVS